MQLNAKTVHYFCWCTGRVSCTRFPLKTELVRQVNDYVGRSFVETNRRTGLDITRIAVDEMHTMFQGGFQDWASLALWRLILDDVLQVGSAIAVDDTHKLRASPLNTALRAFYSERRAAGHATDEITGSLIEVIGKHDDPQLSCKAAASGDLLRFAMTMVRQHRDSITTGEHLFVAGQALEQYLTITRHAGAQLEPQEQRALIEGCLRFRRAAPLCGCRFRPKHHLYVHLVYSAQVFGNPRVWTSTWVDESMNSMLACVAKSAHAWTWSRRILSSFAHGGGPASHGKRKRV